MAIFIKDDEGRSVLFFVFIFHEFIELLIMHPLMPSDQFVPNKSMDLFVFVKSYFTHECSDESSFMLFSELALISMRKSFLLMLEYDNGIKSFFFC